MDVVHFSKTELAYELSIAIMTTLESRFSVLDFVLQLWRKLQNGKPGFKAVARLSGERRSVYAARLVYAHRFCENTNG